MSSSPSFWIASAVLGLLAAARGGEPVWEAIARRRAGRRAVGCVSLASGLVLAAAFIGVTTGSRDVDAQEPPATTLPADSRSADGGESAERSDNAPPSTPSPGPRQLQVPLESIDGSPASVRLDTNRPAWIDEPPILDGPTHSWPVKSDYHDREQEARRALDEELIRGIRNYIVEYLGSPQAPLFFRFDAATIRKRFLPEDATYHEIVHSSVGMMHQLHARLTLDRDFQSELDAFWKQVVSATRLVGLAGIAAVVLACVGVMAAFFRLDTATRGYYTIRLKLLAVVAILAVAALGVAYFRLRLVLVEWLL
ncbi:MAG: hypothetical protein FJ297_15420 [Planctomycetes bacterium]|nr:hypothetical protein [Planctomycetota bacterium]